MPLVSGVLGALYKLVDNNNNNNNLIPPSVMSSMNPMDNGEDKDSRVG